MALRVLLADESSTIKKVFQLALQDFAVDVRPVNVGTDVMTVAQSFKPDIIFADVLLQKKSGYEVSAELKNNAQLNEVPVVLMWSGFMELDEDKFQASHANAQLEKPFDVTALRKLVTDLVPRTHGQRLSQFLSFPKMPEIDETGKKTAASEAATQPATPPPVVQTTAEEDFFKQVSIPKMKGGQSGPVAPANTEKYRLNLSAEDLDPQNVPVKFDLNTTVPPATPHKDDVAEEFSFRDSRKIKSASPPPLIPDIAKEPFDLSNLTEGTGTFSRASTSQPPAASTPPVAKFATGVDSGGRTTAAAPGPDASAVVSGLNLSEAQLEKIIRQQSTEVIESVVWKIVPDLAAQIIERELNRLLKERDMKPY